MDVPIRPIRPHSDIFDLISCQNSIRVIPMNGMEFINRVKKRGKQNNVSVRFLKKRGKGSHGTLYYGSFFTIVKDRKKELGPGLFSKMVTDLSLTKNQLK